MLSKITRRIVPLTNEAKFVVLSNNGNSSNKRSFSIESIGKRYEKPYDYQKKQYGLIGQIMDSTLRKLGENSLIITVEGNFGAGKSAFAQKLAKEIDFVYAREPELDTHLYNLTNGENKRDVVNELIGDNKRFRLDSLEEWHLDPTFKRTIALQHSFYNIRWMQTRTALLHLMSTGQGVVLERSAFSDSVIGSALYEQNLLSDQAFKFYMRDVLPNTLHELWKPHVSIFIDKSPEQCLADIKSNGKPFEKESRVYTLDFLKSVDKNYKKNFLPEMRNQLHVLNYNSSDADTERAIEDLELLDFDDQTKFLDWRIRKETTINSYRKFLADYDICFETLLAPSVALTEVPELLWYGENWTKLKEQLEDEPRLQTEKLSMFTPIRGNSERREWL